jgi:LysR family hydrogen peroxide-inducible transcriptional activator
MDLRQLQAVVAIAEHGSFSAAADALATVQSNVSTHVKKLETELGTQVIDRASGELTEAGQLVVARARRVLGELDSIAADVTALRQDVVGTVRLGAIGTAARWIVPQLVEIIPARHPHLHLVFTEATTSGLDLQLATGQVDLAVLQLPAPGSELRTLDLYEEELVLVVPLDHPLANQGQVPFSALADEELLLPLPGVAYRDLIDKVASAEGITLRTRAETDSVRLVATLTFEGTGVSLLPAGSVPLYLHDRYRLVAVEGLPPRLIGVAQRRRGFPGAPVRAVLDALIEIVGDLERVPRGVRPVPAGKGRQAFGGVEQEAALAADLAADGVASSASKAAGAPRARPGARLSRSR